mgnify:CR=1 FL=1
MRNIILLFFLIVGWTTTVYAQNEQETIEVTGIVTDPKNEPLVGVNVTAKNIPGFGAITDINGRYKIKVPNYSYLIFSYVGFTKQEVFIKDKKIINVVMVETKETVIDEVVVTGTGTQKKVTVTGAVTTVDVSQLRTPTASITNALAGNVAGILARQTSGQPGSNISEFWIRGISTFGAGGSALVLVDGFERDMNEINVEDIQDFSVLKDASATAIYGSRGANGVILIQTKKGKKGAPTVSYKGQVGMQQAQHRIDMMKGAEYVKYTQDYNRMKYGYSGDQLDPLVLLNPSERANYQNGSELDWQDIMFRNALTTSHQISISGGTEATTYMASISHLREDGVMENTGLKRTNIALNITQVLNKWLTVGMGTQAIQKEFGGEQPYLEAGLKMSPYGIYKDENDRYVDYPMDQTLFYNPMANIDATNDKTNRNVFISTFAEIQFLPAVKMLLFVL